MASDNREPTTRNKENQMATQQQIDRLTKIFGKPNLSSRSEAKYFVIRSTKSTIIAQIRVADHVAVRDGSCSDFDLVGDISEEKFFAAIEGAMKIAAEYEAKPEFGPLVKTWAA
jgi:hypothetical protein